MSSLTTERLKAVRLAKERERQLVEEGKGTRDWTPEQQQSILDIGVALDDEGKVFEGQHMKSVSVYPEYAGDPDNIQFLTRQEHLEAHEGNWNNPTNWYYDPISKQKTIFGDSPPVPCIVINLSEPIINISTVTFDSSETAKDEVAEESCFSENKQESTNDDVSNTDLSENISIRPVPVLEKKSRYFPKLSYRGFVKALQEFREKHPIMAAVAKVTFEYGPPIAMDLLELTSTAQNVSTKKAKENKTFQAVSSYTPEITPVNEELNPPLPNAEISPPLPVNNSPSNRASPIAHNVTSHRQRYHYRDGSVKWKLKDIYPRGGDK